MKHEIMRTEPVPLYSKRIEDAMSEIRANDKKAYKAKYRLKLIKSICQQYQVRYEYIIKLGRFQHLEHGITYKRQHKQ